MFGLCGLNHHVSSFIGFTITGCCSNVYTFEKILVIDSQLTTLITFTQYVFIYLSVAIYLWKISFWDKNDLKKKGYFNFSWEFFIPLASQIVSSYIGNLVFQYNLSMPTHIIFRSSGTAMTILLGYLLWNKRYNKEKIFGSALIAIGTILFTLDAKGEMVYEENENDNYQDNLTGISLLLLATIINSMTSLYKEQIYQGKKNDTKKIEWREVLYYNYFYGIIMYIPLLGKVNNELQRLKTLDGIIIFTFLMNWITQLTCILGVNILTFKISALSLTIVLLVRRFLSLIISIYIFNNSIHFNGFLGIIAVFTGAIVYSFGSLTNKFEKTNKLKD